MKRILENFFSNMGESTFLRLLENNIGFAELYAEQHKVKPIFDIKRILMTELLREEIPYHRMRQLLSLAVISDIKLHYSLFNTYLFKRVSFYEKNETYIKYSKIIIELFFETVDKINEESLKELLENKYFHFSLREIIVITEEVPDAFVIPRLEEYYLNSDDKKDLFIEFLSERYSTGYRDIDVIFLSILGDEKAPDKDNLIKHFYIAVKYCFNDDKERVKKLRMVMATNGYLFAVEKDMGLFDKLNLKRKQLIDKRS